MQACSMGKHSTARKLHPATHMHLAPGAVVKSAGDTPIKAHYNKAATTLTGKSASTKTCSSIFAPLSPTALRIYQHASALQPPPLLPPTRPMSIQWRFERGSEGLPVVGSWGGEGERSGRLLCSTTPLAYTHLKSQRLSRCTEQWNE